jgi:hypothetical protein
VHDVVTQHRKTNPSNRPPQLTRLSIAATHQANNCQHDNNDIDMQSGAESDHLEQKRATRHSKSTGEAKPDTLKYYKGTSWSSVLEKAKMKYRRHIALRHGFPDRDTDLGDASKLIAEAMAEFEDDGGILNDSEFIHTCKVCTFIIFSSSSTQPRYGLPGKSPLISFYI